MKKDACVSYSGHHHMFRSFMCRSRPVICPGHQNDVCLLQTSQARATEPRKIDTANVHGPTTPTSELAKHERTRGKIHRRSVPFRDKLCLHGLVSPRLMPTRTRAAVVYHDDLLQSWLVGRFKREKGGSQGIVPACIPNVTRVLESGNERWLDDTAVVPTCTCASCHLTYPPVRFY